MKKISIFTTVLVSLLFSLETYAFFDISQFFGGAQGQNQQAAVPDLGNIGGMQGIPGLGGTTQEIPDLGNAGDVGGLQIDRDVFKKLVDDAFNCLTPQQTDEEVLAVAQQCLDDLGIQDPAELNERDMEEVVAVCGDYYIPSQDVMDQCTGVLKQNFIELIGR